MTQASKPLPKQTRVGAPFWKATKEHRLVAPKCQKCGTLFFYPRHLCPSCLNDTFDWPVLSGKGKVYSYTIIHQAAIPAFQDDTPYVFAVIELDEGIRLASNVIGCKPEEVSIGQPVEVVFEDVSPEVTLPKFRPASP